jgi:hypothetical protein
MSNVIRTLRVKIFDREGQVRDAYFQVGSEMSFGKGLRKTIHSIEYDANEREYHVYAKMGDEVQLWKQEPKNEYTSVEFDND